MAAVDYFNDDPVVHTWTYKLDKAASYDSNFENAELVGRFSQIEGYRCLSLMRALGVVNCQLALV
jgi:hypothetical protein